MNCYLVREDDGLTLVDSTMSSPAADVSHMVGELGLELRRVALTHAHGDHAGGVAGVRQLFPGIEVSIGEREARHAAVALKDRPHAEELRVASPEARHGPHAPPRRDEGPPQPAAHDRRGDVQRARHLGDLQPVEAPDRGEVARHRDDRRLNLSARRHVSPPQARPPRAATRRRPRPPTRRSMSASARARSASFRVCRSTM